MTMCMWKESLVVMNPQRIITGSAADCSALRSILFSFSLLFIALLYETSTKR